MYAGTPAPMPAVTEAANQSFLAFLLYMLDSNECVGDVSVSKTCHINLPSQLDSLDLQEQSCN